MSDEHRTWITNEDDGLARGALALGLGLMVLAVALVVIAILWAV